MELNGKKVLVVCTTDNMIWQFLIPSINMMSEMGAEVHCACNETGFWFEELQTKNGLNMHKMPFERSPFKPSNLKAYKALKALVKEQKYDLIYCHQPVGGVMGRLVAKKFNIPVIYVAHGFHFYKGCPKKNLLFKWIETYCAKHTTALVTMNEEDYQASLKMKAKKKYKINGIGLDLSKYKKDKTFDRQKFRESLGLTQEDFVLLSVGELNENKNTLRLIDAVKGVDNENVKYLICGQGPLAEEYTKKIAELGLENQVKMLGFRKDIPEILSSVDCFMMPSYREGLSKAMMEAMAYGLPVVASKIRGNVDLLGDNEGGILVAPNDTNGFSEAIGTILNNQEETKLMANYNSNKIKDYAIDVVLQQLQKVCSEVEINE